MTPETLGQTIWCAATEDGAYVLGSGDKEIAKGLTEDAAKTIVEGMRAHRGPEGGRVQEAYAYACPDARQPAGFNMYLTTHKNGVIAMGSPDAAPILRLRITRELLDFIDSKMRLVTANKFESVKTHEFPESGKVLCSGENNDVYWSMVIDDEAFRLMPDEGGPELVTETIFMNALLDSIGQPSDAGESCSWINGALMMSDFSATSLATRVEDSFPEYLAEAIRQRMEQGIAAGEGKLASAPLSTQTRRRPSL